MIAPYRVSRRIEIDAGHRIMTHGSKCRHLHGHRYAVEAVCEAVHLHDAGEQTDMVVDFGFLKQEMMEAIDTPCDHGFIAAAADDGLLAMFAPEGTDAPRWIAAVRATVAEDGFCATTDTRLATKLLVVPFQPTAECLARHWYERLAGAVASRSDGCARLVAVRVWETPNCVAEYGPQ
ncbi:MAG: 6-carboxytetrahydropterin synthase [Actinomycetota bacterium]